jgi:hypothetical protein
MFSDTGFTALLGKHLETADVPGLTSSQAGDHLTPASYSFHLPSEDSSQVMELLYDWRFTVNQFVLRPSPLTITTRDFFCNSTLAVIILS